jgi:hypothetical protein
MTICHCGGQLTELDFPIVKPKAKAQWLAVGIKEAGRGRFRGVY